CKGDLEEAAAACRKATRFGPDLAYAHYCLGNVLMLKGDLTGAANSYNDAIRLEPSIPDPHHNLAVVLGMKGARREADAALEEAPRVERAALEKELATLNEIVGLRPGDADAHNMLGAFRAEALEDYVGAADSFRKALQFRPGFVDAQRNLGRALGHQGNLNG